MKLSLVVASGAHQGKVIAITGPQFLIGRDTQCQLRPASQAISKVHCGVLVRDGQVYIKDFGSTNGTLVNDILIRAAEVQVANGVSLKLGPLDFIVRIEVPAANPDGTPLPADTPEAAAAIAAVKAATSGIASRPASRDATPTPIPGKKPTPVAVKPGSKEAPALKPGTALTGSKEAAALKGATPVKSGVTPTPPAKHEPAPEPTITSSLTATSEDDDKMAALLLMDDATGVPEGSTVVELPAVDAQGNPIKPEVKADDKPKKPALAQSREEMSSAASDLLRKMMRRPK